MLSRQLLRIQRRNNLPWSICHNRSRCCSHSSRSLVSLQKHGCKMVIWTLFLYKNVRALSKYLRKINNIFFM
ncbi:hypothetical protein Hanom_Chr13g01185561 [Helianthus anomalus]